MPCKICGETSINPWTAKEEDICWECKSSKNTNLDEVTSERERKNSSRESWYWKKWVWIWLIIFLPAGVYGLVQRAPSEHQKWWWIGLGIFVLFCISSGGAGNGSRKVSQSSYDQFQSSNDPIDELVKRCAAKAGIPANDHNHAITPAEMRALTSCVDRNM